MRRSIDYDEHISEQLRNAEYRGGFLLSIMETIDDEPGMELFEALKYVIAKMGVTEFAKLVKMERSSVSRILSQEATPKVETLDKFLAPFGLKVKIDVEEVA